MASRSVTIRNGVFDKIEADKSGYVDTGFDTEKTYYPQETLKELGLTTKVKVVGMSVTSVRDRTYRSAPLLLLEVPIQVAVQRKVVPTDTTTIDTLTELVEEIMESLEDDELVTGTPHYTWNRTEPLHDENGLIYSYEQLTVEGVFQAIFTAFYQYPKGG